MNESTENNGTNHKNNGILTTKKDFEKYELTTQFNGTFLIFSMVVHIFLAVVKLACVFFIFLLKHK